MEMTPQYSAGLEGWEKGCEYQNWVVSRWPLCYNGKTLTLRETREAQLTGETDEGVEIKFDDKIYTYSKSGRLYIETHEKQDEANAEYALSGIYRQDNSRFYLIGNYSHWWIFQKRVLVEIEKDDPPWLYRPKPTSTSKGYCLPLEYADQFCERFQQFDEDGNPMDNSWIEGLP